MFCHKSESVEINKTQQQQQQQKMVATKKNHDGELHIKGND